MSSLRAASIALVVFLVPFLVAAQVRPQFEVAAIKPAAVELSGDFVLGLNAKGSQVHISWASLVDLVNMAYRVKRYQVSGPSWLGADHFWQRRHVHIRRQHAGCKEIASGPIYGMVFELPG